MKKFIWKKIEHRNTGEIGHSASLLEFVDSEHIIFWGSVSLYPTPEWKYQFVAFPKNREGGLRTTLIPADTVSDAMDAIEDFLFEQGVLSEDDDVDDEVRTPQFSSRIAENGQSSSV